MKKLLGISLVAILATTPLMAMADPVGTGETPATESGTAVTATGDAPFALIGANAATDGNAATAGYVKGAYNAAIKAVNTVHGEVTDINTNKANKDFSNVAAGAIAKEKLATDVQTSLGKADTALQTGNNVSLLTNDAGYLTSTDLNGLATEDGVEATIKNTNISVGQFALTSGAVSGSITVPMMDDWSNPNTASSTGLVVNGNAIQLAVGTAIDEGTVAIDRDSVDYSTTVNQ